MNSQQRVAKKYCKVCLDAGKPESEYRSHFTRESADPNSKVICPTLLALECRYCFKKGHTVKYCDVLKRNERNRMRYQEYREPEIKKKVIEKCVLKTSNTFECLDSDEEDEKAIQSAIQSASQSASQSAIQSASQSVSVGRNYADALKRVVVKEPEVKQYIQAAKATPVAAKATPVAAKATPVAAKSTPVAAKALASRICWADMESSDEEDDF